MNAIDVIKTGLGISQTWVLGMLQDMKDAPLTAPTPNGGNHPLWVLGHLTYSELELRECLMHGRPHPIPEWKDLFGRGSQPTDDAAKYPSMDELLQKFEEVRAETLAMLDGMTDADLDQPSNVPEDMADFFGTFGKCLTAISLHFTLHGGQVADARRAAGKGIMMG